MNIYSVTKEEYSNSIREPYQKFNHSEFNCINSSNADTVCYLLFKDTKIRLGIIGGLKDNIFLSPFSAPFGGFSFVKNDIRINIIETCIKLLLNWCMTQKIQTIKITLPPEFYHNSFIYKQINSLYRNDFIFEKDELNYQFNCNTFNKDYKQNIWHSARKSLNKSLDNKLQFKVCESKQDSEMVYSIVKKNREQRGFPLRMTYQDIIKTDLIIKKDYFVITNIDNIAIASAITYYVTDSIVQVVYWGDIPEYSNLRSMNFLSYKIFEYYSKREIKYIDIGPSTENSIPNYGLCEFKESIGCEISPKYTFTKNIKEN